MNREELIKYSGAVVRVTLFGGQFIEGHLELTPFDDVFIKWGIMTTLVSSDDIQYISRPNAD